LTSVCDGSTCNTKIAVSITYQQYVLSGAAGLSNLVDVKLVATCMSVSNGQQGIVNIDGIAIVLA
jgi:hypothetical protein